MEIIQVLPRLFPLRNRNVLEPGHQGFIVMGSCIHHTVPGIIVRQIIAGVSRVALVKGELDHPHIGITAVCHKLFHRIGHISKIFRDNVPRPQLL